MTDSSDADSAATTPTTPETEPGNSPVAPDDALRAVEKDPDDWVTGDEKMTGPQASYLETLKREAGEDFDASLTKAQASQEIDRLQESTGRGQESS